MRIERISGAILILLSGVLLLMAAYQRPRLLLQQERDSH